MQLYYSRVKEVLDSLEKKKLISIPLMIVTAVTGALAWVGSLVAGVLSSLLSHIPLIGGGLATVISLPFKIVAFPAKILFFVLIIVIILKFILAFIANRKVKQEKKQLQKTLDTQQAMIQQQQAMVQSQINATSNSNAGQLQSMKSFD